MENFGRRRSGGGRRFGGGGGGGRFGGGGGRHFDNQEKPVKEGETYDVEIIEVGARGDGIAKIQNFVIFVSGTKKGDKVKVRITQLRGSSAVAEVVSEGAEEKSDVESESGETGQSEEKEITEETSDLEPEEDLSDAPVED